MHDLQLSNVDFEPDAKRVVDYYNKGKDDVSEFGTIIEECKRCCQTYLENSNVEFSRRQTNSYSCTRGLILKQSSYSIDVPHCIFFLERMYHVVLKL